MYNLPKCGSRLQYKMVCLLIAESVTYRTVLAEIDTIRCPVGLKHQEYGCSLRSHVGYNATRLSLQIAVECYSCYVRSRAVNIAMWDASVVSHYEWYSVILWVVVCRLR